MHTRLTLIVTVAFCLLEVLNASPQRCEESTFQYNGIYLNNSIAISADIKLVNSSTVMITNIGATVANLTNATMDVSLNQLCVYGRAGDMMTCNDNFTDTITAPIGDTNVIELQMNVAAKNQYFESDVYVPFYSGVIDGNGISFFDGRLYDENTTCLNYAYQDGQTLNFNVSECCNSMKPINITTTNTQTCSHFTSVTTIAKPGDANPYASISIDYGIVNNNVTMFGRFNGSVEYNPYLLIDDAQGCAEILNGTIYCGYPLSDGGNKLLVFMSEYFNYTQVYGLANRIIIRDGLALMDDVTPFTPNNTCQTFNATYDSSRNLMISTTSCCTSFQVYTPPDGSSSPSPQTTSVGTTTTSGAKSVSVLNFFSLLFVVIVSFLVFNV